MNWSFRCVILVLLLAEAQISLAQQNVTTFGIQIKPMIPSKFFSTGNESVIEDEIGIDFQPKLGWNFGMIIRKGFSKMWSLETGICQVQRNFTMLFNHPDLKEQTKLSFRYICYEIPIQGIVFVKLSDQLYMNASGGMSLDFYPTNVTTSTTVNKDSLHYDFYQKTWKKSWVQVAMLANYGFEWRSKESGYFYLGASYHRPFSPIGITRVHIEKNSVPTDLGFFLKGNYLTIDFRYFFHENPEKKKPREK
jgi:hypothetical protein